MAIKKKSRRIMYNVVTFCRSCRTRMVSPRGEVRYQCGSCQTGVRVRSSRVAAI
ncbi:MAG TPA: hypothetical protein VJH22_03430 [Candidatus Nanoarchaeia archaeon]|nr:hypothetical protein [Candidatus Nanoarchaeia archaeon]